MDKKAYCSSYKCAGDVASTLVEKNVKPRAMECPDCKSILIWKAARRIPVHVASHRTNPRVAKGLKNARS